MDRYSNLVEPFESVTPRSSLRLEIEEAFPDQKQSQSDYVVLIDLELVHEAIFLLFTVNVLLNLL